MNNATVIIANPSEAKAASLDMEDKLFEDSKILLNI